MRDIFERGHSVILLGIAGSFAASVLLFLFGLAGIVAAMFDAITASGTFGYDNLKEFSIALLQIIDIFLLATVMYIVAIGLYELFIDEKLKLPDWLRVHTLEDLKSLIIGVIVVILPVVFLGKLVEWKSGQDILWMGLAVAVVLLAIAATQFAQSRNRKLK